MTRLYSLPRYYTEITHTLHFIREASDRFCSQRLQPFLTELVRVLRQHGEQEITATLEEQLCRSSPATIDRCLVRYRRGGGRRALTTTRPGNWLKGAISVRTFADWQENKPGFLEADLVLFCHCSGLT